MPKLIIAKSVNDAFIKIACELHLRPDFISSPRGNYTREMLGVLIRVDNPLDRLVKNIHRKISLKYLIGEWLWYERGSNSLNEISYYSKFWRSISDDGYTSNSAYGQRILGLHPLVGLNQWEYAKNQLIKDKETRRATILISLTCDSKINTKDTPCTIYLQFFIRNNQLHLTANMRSNDLVFGFSYDAACFTMFQEKMYMELKKYYTNLKIGYYLHFASSMHIYKRHYQMIKNVLREPNKNIKANMPKMNNLMEIKKLQYNEKVIRERNGIGVKKINDKFCIWCQNILINKI